MFTQEFYEHDEMKKNRLAAITTASKATQFGLILGTLGRQVVKIYSLKNYCSILLLQYFTLPIGKPESPQRFKR
jgi:diphthamide biosynthesis enzyme Dph1/Dph2-like protein